MQNGAALWNNCQTSCKDSLEDMDSREKRGHCENARREIVLCDMRISKMGRIHFEYLLFIHCYEIENSFSIIPQVFIFWIRFDGGFLVFAVWCCVFDHFAVTRHNAGCSQQVTTMAMSPNLLITHQLLICVKDNQNLKSCHHFYGPLHFLLDFGPWIWMSIRDFHLDLTISA